MARRYEFYVRVARTISRHENIKFISSSQRVMFFLLYGENSIKAIGGNRDVIERYDKGDIRKIRTRVPDEVTYGIYEWFSSQ